MLLTGDREQISSGWPSFPENCLCLVLMHLHLPGFDARMLRSAITCHRSLNAVVPQSAVRGFHEHHDAVCGEVPDDNKTLPLLYIPPAQNHPQDVAFTSSCSVPHNTSSPSAASLPQTCVTEDVRSGSSANGYAPPSHQVIDYGVEEEVFYVSCRVQVMLLLQRY